MTRNQQIESIIRDVCQKCPHPITPQQVMFRKWQTGTSVRSPVATLRGVIGLRCIEELNMTRGDVANLFRQSWQSTDWQVTNAKNKRGKGLLNEYFNKDIR